MSVSQVIAASRGSLNRGSHLSGDACHMMPRSLARGAVREVGTGRSADWGEGPHRAGVDPVRPVGSRRAARMRSAGVRSGWSPPQWGPAGPDRGVSAGRRPTAFGRPGPAAPRGLYPPRDGATRCRCRAPDTERPASAPSRGSRPGCVRNAGPGTRGPGRGAGAGVRIGMSGRRAAPVARWGGCDGVGDRRRLVRPPGEPRRYGRSAAGARRMRDGGSGRSRRERRERPGAAPGPRPRRSAPGRRAPAGT